MKIYKLILVLILTNIFISCDDFLEEAPSKTTAIVPETIEDLEALFNDYGRFGGEGAAEVVYTTDDFALIPELIDGLPSAISIKDAQHGTWDIDFISTDDRPYWPEEWRKVFTANLVLLQLPNVSGDENQKKQLEAEAHFIRAYSYFQLANVYCLPFSDANKGELGLPIKISTSFEESVARTNLDETWAFIEADLMKALELNRELSTVNGFDRIWRANTAAVNGFAARFYLAKNDYASAQNYAQKALDEHSTLRNYNTDMSFSTIPTEATVIIGGVPQNVAIDYPYTHDLQTIPDDKFGWGESYYYRFLENGGWNYYPSPELLSIYDQTYDLRYKFHIVEDYTYDRGATDPAYSYPGYIFFFKSDILSGPSVPEMLLTKAECQIRQGDFSGGIATANILRAARMDVAAPANLRDLNAGSQAEALTKVLEERRREMPFVHRWFDIRRFNNNSDASDDIVITRTFYPYNVSTILTSETPINYTLDKNSRRFARPLPVTDIIASEGVLQQNEY
ncbi:RagB/SusD family nutrient uptake outer membrane protein [Flavivirga spongiicola]|uniref:RagB/SusD family nutrient uptake outer membrane protein n=1 Tax=Flavivirga spongiicola TaxID=421621 RepID=A0ABU7XPY9_9FLAO|nr:RagB/SusD family nutrient uptake outer membrane protein [Flavivirga sp. MEBiC05379]MDO5977832.1 RagB/SusD family nutrient uptake outer membrane protein [Flavivirga sp. MEBiC05379]